LQLERLGFDESAAVAAGALAALIVKPVGTLAMVGLMARGALGRLEDALAIESFAFTRLTVQPWGVARRGRVKVALDGEVTSLAPPLVFRRTTQALQLLVPRAAPDAPR
jgi:diacylglycerol kinase family enzyme